MRGATSTETRAEVRVVTGRLRGETERTGGINQIWWTGHCSAITVLCQITASSHGTTNGGVGTNQIDTESSVSITCCTPSTNQLRIQVGTLVTSDTDGIIRARH